MLETITGRFLESINLISFSSISENSILISVSLVVIVAAIVAFISKLFKQEIILAYVVSGILLGPLVFGIIKDKALITGLAEIGITFLLFTVGLEMSIKKLKETVGTSFLAGIIQVLAVTAVSFFILVAFSFSSIEAVWVGMAIAFSSTVVVTKILSDRNELNTLHARFIIGIMLAQDIIAIIALAVLTKNFSISFVIFSFLKLLLMAIVAFFLNILIKRTLKKAAVSTELLFIISLAFLFLFVMIAHFLNFSIAIGAFTAGILIANTPYKLEIESRTRALRDFFSVMFFVSVGMLLTSFSKDFIYPLIFLLLVLIVFEPLVTAIVLRARGYKSKSSLQIGFSFAQLSEFSLILILTALSIGIITQKAFDLIVWVTVISIAATPYTMKLATPFHKVLGHFLDNLKLPFQKEKGYSTPAKKTILLFGCHRMGSIYLRNLKKYQDKITVLDFNPETINHLSDKKISCIYGDASNEEFINNLDLKNIKLAISTMPEKENNLMLLKKVKNKNKNIFVALTAEKIHEALELYDKGADYVILPLVAGAEQSIEMIKKLTEKDFRKMKKEHVSYLKELHRLLY